MKYFDLNAYLSDRAHAASEMSDINDALERMRKLRAQGVAKGGYSLVEPYGRSRRLPREDGKRKPYFKRSNYA